MQERNELIKLMLNIQALLVASVPVALDVAMGIFSEKMADTVNGLLSTNISDSVQENLDFFQNKIASEMITKIWSQLDAVEIEMLEDNADLLVSLMQPENLAKTNQHLHNLSELTPKHLPRLNQTLTEEQFSQYLILLVSESSVGENIIQLNDWLQSNDPKVKAREQKQQAALEHAQKLITAIDNQNIEEIKILHDSGLSLTEINNPHDTEPMEYAIKNADANIVAAIFDMVEVDNAAYTQSMLRVAIEHNKIDTVHTLANYLNKHDEAEQAFAGLLFEQYEGGRVDYAKIIFDYQPDLDLDSNDRGEDLLTEAIKSDNAELIALLYKHGLDINTEVYAKSSAENSSVSQYPAYHLARQYKSWEAFSKLAKYAVKINQCYIERDGEDYGLTYLGTYVLDTEQFTEDDEVAIDHYVSAGAVLAIKDNNKLKQALLHYSVCTGQDYEQALEKFHCNVATERALVKAILNLDKDKIWQLAGDDQANIGLDKSLLESGPLKTAIEITNSDNLEILTHLITESGMCEDEYGEYWDFPIDVALDGHHLDAFGLLFRLAKKHEIDLNDTSKTYVRLVHENKPDYLRELINYHPDYAFDNDEREIDDEELAQGFVVIIEAVKHGNFELLKQVVETGLNYGYTKSGQTAYELAEEYGYTHLLPLLSNTP